MGLFCTILSSMASVPETGKRFDLDTGVLCLDFANTWEDRGRPETEKLRSIDDLLTFATQSGIATPALVARVDDFRASHPGDARRALDDCLVLRERIYRMVSAQAAGKGASSEDLSGINRALAAAYAGQRLESNGGGYRWDWPSPEDGLAPILHPILRSLGELLVSGDLERLRECDGPACTWLFVDASRNGSRRWCSMKTCGNRAKAHRHYRRQKSHRSSD